MQAARRRVVLVGNPNTGKSTLFNALSGLSARTGNYAGVTIEKKIGRLEGVSSPIEVVDLPGTYSLSPRSPDELVAVSVLAGTAAGEPVPDLIVCVVNATIIKRNLFLVSQLRELGLPIIVALNMMDAARARKLDIDCDELSRHLEVPVVPISASRREGIDRLRQTIEHVLVAPQAPPPLKLMPSGFYQAAAKLSERWSNSASTADVASGQLNKPNSSTATAEPTAVLTSESALLTQASSQVRSYLVQRAILDHGGEVERLLTGRDEAKRLQLAEVREELRSSLGDLNDLECESRYGWSERMVASVFRTSSEIPHELTDRLDSVLTHRVFGPLCFAAMMLLVFQFIYSWSGVPMGWIEEGQQLCVDVVELFVGPGMLRSLIVDGIIGGVGGVVIFLPQIALLFFFLAILEDCGYMARAAFLVDRIMSLLGLSGKSFLPLMSSFACAVPGIMATRVIENSKDRFATIFVAPFMSCSARLPVYLLLISAFVPSVLLGGWLSLQGLVLLAMYFVGVLVAIPTAWLLKRTVLHSETAPLVLELPEYKWPDWKVILYRVYEACYAFVVRAGTLIFAASILIWAAAYFPGNHTAQFRLERILANAEDLSSDQLNETELKLNQENARLLEVSFLGRAGKMIEPIVRPLGWDWRIGVGAIASFPAREVIIATLGTVYSLGGDVDEEDAGLMDAMKASTWPDGRPVYNLPVALSIMVFFALCAQCVSTLLVMKRETNSWRWPVFSFTYMTTLAYLGALFTYQISSRWW